MTSRVLPCCKSGELLLHTCRPVTDPAAAARGPTHVVNDGRNAAGARRREWNELLDSIPAETVRDLRDRALIATLTYSFTRI